jgi:hypothetical protein
MKDTEEGTNKEKVLHVYGLKKKSILLKMPINAPYNPKQSTIKTSIASKPSHRNGKHSLKSIWNYKKSSHNQSNVEQKQ